MVRTAEWTVSRGNDERQFIAHYLDDPPDRAGAIAFFTALDVGLYSCSPDTDELWAMPIGDANAYLASNPVIQTYRSLYLRGRCDSVLDGDLMRLTYIPELLHFHIHSDNVTDDGIRHIANSLPNLERLLIDSALVTDAGLDLIASLKSLSSLSMQSCPLVSTNAFARLTAQLPNIVDAYQPHH